MLYLHSADLIHRDLKSMNIMIAEGLRGKIADYGESREESSDMTMTSTGTPLWMAPEVSCGERYDSQADVYSFGVILFEVLERELPYNDRKDLNGVGLAVEVALKGLRPTIDETWHPELKKMLKECYELVPSDRPTFSEIALRLESVIAELDGGSDKAKAAAKEGSTTADVATIDMGENFRSLPLWRAIQTSPHEIKQGDLLGKVGFCVVALNFRE